MHSRFRGVGFVLDCKRRCRRLWQEDADAGMRRWPLMPKGVVDGDALWRSDKLNQIELPSCRAEYAHLQFNRGLLLGLRVKTVVHARGKYAILHPAGSPR